MKAILVVGATGQQGNTVIRAMTESDDYLCLALTRNLDSPKAQKLKSFKNVQLVSADLGDIQQLRTLFENAALSPTGKIWGVFVALAFPGLGMSAEGEEKQGKAVDDIGRFSRAIFDNPSRFKHKTIDIAGDTLTPQELAQAFVRATGHEMPSVPGFLISTILRLNFTGHDTIDEFIQADRTRRMDPRGFDANLQEAASYLKLTSFEEWAQNWDRPTSDNEHGITLWGLFTGGS
ncbi:hypothetical protein BN14_07120 [Rhizoctonia solani AG-1 IB]|uniref:NmrA-like domain-containing protein n=1 Tax=Thanatephorus cucumeris (strain AG1-IB / isolate 7/3/14) TaxID=1108050 RepID=M5C0R6_THACB|nr:hypothetical protein BN14_07120 [Rhizoctonia solani AG-1 IB]